jgi:CRP-like cAMP-binding protein
LKDFPPFKTVPAHFMRQVYSICETIRCAPGDVLIEQETVADCMYFIVRGSVRVYDTRRRKNLAVISYGRWVGEMCLFQEVRDFLKNLYYLAQGDSLSIRSASVICANFCEFLRLGRREFWNVVSRNPKVADRFYDILNHVSDDGAVDAFALTCLGGCTPANPK